MSSDQSKWNSGALVLYHGRGLPTPLHSLSIKYQTSFREVFTPTVDRFTFVVIPRLDHKQNHWIDQKIAKSVAKSLVGLLAL